MTDKANGVHRRQPPGGRSSIVTQARTPAIPHSLDAKAVAALLAVRPESGLDADEAL